MASQKTLLEKISRTYFGIGIVLIITSFLILLVSLKPSIWYSINKGATTEERDSISSVAEGLNSPTDEDTPHEDTLPPLDPILPLENKLIITSIGVDSVIIEDPNAHSGLEQGIWIVPDFGTPPENDQPIILAAHRFGYLSWTTEFRNSSSFYNLPKTKKGERVQIIWEQRAYEYEIYKTEEGSQITDYNADLILYTCKLFNSPVRIFRYLSRAN